MQHTARRSGGQILVAAAATAAGFLAFVPTDFSGVAELGLIAGVGMLIAFSCTITVLPAAIAVVGQAPRRRRKESPGSPGPRTLDRKVWRRPALARRSAR